MSKKELIKICQAFAIAQCNAGALFVIDINKKPLENYYTSQYGTLAKNGAPLNIYNSNDQQIIERIANLDGAVIIDAKGNLVSIGATLTRHKNLIGHGKRHAFAVGTSELQNIICILGSEEDHHVRIFEAGRLIKEIDAKSSEEINMATKLLGNFNPASSTSTLTSGAIASAFTLNPTAFLISLGTVVVGNSANFINNTFNKKKKSS